MQRILPKGLAGLGDAAYAASPMLFSMAQSMQQGQPAFSQAGQGLSGMMALQDRQRSIAQSKASAEAAALEASNAEAKRASDLAAVSGFFGSAMGGGQPVPQPPQPASVTPAGLDMGQPVNASLPAPGALDMGAPVASPQDRELLAKTLMAEAGGEGLEGMVAAGAVINNRVASGRYGDGLQGVIKRPGQFSAWNGVTGYAGGQGALDMANIKPSQTAYQAADLLLSGNYSDPTGGATHYYNPAVANPAWGQARAGGEWQRIGNHIFGAADPGGRVTNANIGRDPVMSAQSPVQSSTGRQPQFDPNRLAQIVMSGNVPESVKKIALERAFPSDGDPVNWQRFEGADGGQYAFNPTTTETVQIMPGQTAKSDLHFFKGPNGGHYAYNPDTEETSQILAGEADDAGRQALAAEAMAAHEQGEAYYTAWRNGNLSRISQNGFKPDSFSYESAPVTVRGIVGGAEGVVAAQDLGKGPEQTSAMRNAEYAAQQSGLAPGTPEFGQFVADMMNPKSTLQERVDALSGITGVDPDTAVKVATGAIATTIDPTTRQASILDKTQAPQSVTPQGVPQGMPPAMPQAVPQGAPPPLQMPSAVPTGGVAAFGLEGIAKGGVNAVSDFIGQGEVYPEAAEHARFFGMAEEDLLNQFAQAYGRQPAQALMERIRKLMPQAGTFEGAEKAKGELRQLMNKFERDSQALQKRLSEPLSPKAREEVNNRLNGLYMSRQTVYEALQRLQPKGVVLSDEDNALIDKYLEAN